MSIAVHASNPIAGLPPGMGTMMTCHVGTWFWAAEEAVAQGMTSAKAVDVRLGNIGAMPNGAQRAMLALPRAGAIDLGRNGAVLPPVGTVLLWLEGPTHSAVVTANGIAGYNQACVFPNVPNTGTHSVQPIANLAANRRICYMILETDVVRAAGGALHL